MAKRITLKSLESGRAELPRRYEFLLTESLGLVSVAETDDGWTADVSVDALKKLVKARADLKSIKSDGKKAAGAQAGALKAEQEAHEQTRQALAKAERRLKKLEAKLASEDAPATPAAPKASANEKTKGSRRAEARSTKKPSKAGRSVDLIESLAPAPSSGPVIARPAAKPAVPKKVSAKKATLAAAPVVESTEAAVGLDTQA